MTLKDLSTTEEELAQALTVAAAEGFIYRGLVQAPLGGHAVVVLDHDDMEAARLEYLVLATVRLTTLEREIAEAAGLGYRVMGLTMNGGGAFDFNDKIGNSDPARPTPRTRRECRRRSRYCPTTGSRAPRARSNSAVLSEGALALPYSTR